MSAHLHFLIKSLSKSEKRYFKLSSGLSSDGEEKNYFRLFDLIEEQKTYDEKKIKAELDSPYFAQLKKHLEKKVMESLRSFHEGNDVDSQISVLIQNVELLEARSFYVQAQKELKRAELIASSHELFSHLIRIQEKKTELISKSGNSMELNKHLEQTRKILPLWLNQLDNKLLFEKEYLLFAMKNKEAEFVRSKEELENLKKGMNFNLLKKEENALSLSAKKYFNYVNGLFYYLSGDLKLSLKHFERLEFLYEKNSYPETSEYARSLANLSLLYNLHHQFKKSEDCIAKISQLKFTTAADKLVFRYRELMLRLNLMVKQNNFEDASRFYSRVEGEIQETEANFGSVLINEQHILLPDICRALIGTGAWKKASALINNYLILNKGDNKTDTYILLRLIFCFLQIKLNKDELAESQIRSIQRFLKEKKKNYLVENLCLKYFSDLLMRPDKADQKKLCEKFTEELRKLKSDPFEKNVFYIFDLNAFVL